MLRVQHAERRILFDDRRGSRGIHSFGIEDDPVPSGGNTYDARPNAVIALESTG